jgi:hypothetical protein
MNASKKQPGKFNFTSMDFGNIKEGRTVELTPGADFDIDSYGSMFSYHTANDEGRFVYTRVKGDFDFQVRVESIHSDSYNLTEAGIMARKSLDPDSIFVCPAVTNNEYRGEAILFTYANRIVPGGHAYSHGESQHQFHGDGTWGNEGYNHFIWGYAAQRSDLFPRTFPYVWLRIKKTGNVYAGYFKQNIVPEESWTLLGQWEIDLGAEPYVGMNIHANHHTMNWKPETSDADIAAMKKVRAQVKYRDLQILV